MSNQLKIQLVVEVDEDGFENGQVSDDVIAMISEGVRQPFTDGIVSAAAGVDVDYVSASLSVLPVAPTNKMTKVKQHLIAAINELDQFQNEGGADDDVVLGQNVAILSYLLGGAMDVVCDSEDIVLEDEEDDD